MIDLRSDTVTRPGPAMRAAMLAADVGDDVFGEDPTVNALQDRVAALLGHEAAIFVPSGTMANQIALHLLTRPGDEIICDEASHILHYEGGALALLSGVQVRPVPADHGLLSLQAITGAVRTEMYWAPRSRVISLENTHNLGGGSVYPLAALREIAEYARSKQLKLHLDGARLWNACAATGVAPADYASLFDTVSIALSKGLGAPAGSLVAGSRDSIEQARRVRKQFGGGMRQVGILAAAGLYALEHLRGRLREDHENAQLFAERIKSFELEAVTVEPVPTNIVLIRTHGAPIAQKLVAVLRDAGVLLVAMNESTLRAVTHLDVGREQVLMGAETVGQVLMRHAGNPDRMANG